MLFAPAEKGQGFIDVFEFSFWSLLWLLQF